MTRRKQEGPLEGAFLLAPSLLHFYSGLPLQYRSGVDRCRSLKEDYVR